MAPFDPALLKAAATLSWFALLFAGERLWPAAPRPAAARGWSRLGRNLGLWAATAALSLLLVVPISAWAAGHALDWRPAWWTGPAAVALDFLVLDAWLYAWHRANHQMPFLWRFHRVHHLDRFLDTTTAGRFHIGEVALSALARAPLILLAGMPLGTVIAFEALVQGASLFHHSNLRLPPRLEAALSRLVITPSLHWVHHHRVQADTDSTYGTVLSGWDRLFGSTTRTRRTPDMEIGVQGEEERGLAGLLARPLG